MLFHITQTHAPESCPKDVGGYQALYNPNVEGVRLRAMFAAFAEHVIYYLVEADTLPAVHEFLLPGFTRCTCRITPVTEELVMR